VSMVMSEYRVGQKVFIEWPDGSSVTGTVGELGGRLFVNFSGNAKRNVDLEWAKEEGATVTILAEPRPDEPTGLGAVVETYGALTDEREKWVLMDKGRWRGQRSGFYRDWVGLIDPVVLSEGWVE
jgi:hypothetical protein